MIRLSLDNKRKDFWAEARLKAFLLVLPNDKYRDMEKKAAGFLPEKLCGEGAALFSWFACETVRLSK